MTADNLSVASRAFARKTPDMLRAALSDALGREARKGNGRASRRGAGLLGANLHLAAFTVAALFFALMIFPAAGLCGILSESEPPRASLRLVPLSGPPGDVEELRAVLSPGPKPGVFTARMGKVLLRVEEKAGDAAGRSSISCRAELAPLCGEKLLAGLCVTLPAPLGPAPDPAGVQACLGCRDRYEVFRLDQNDEQSFSWLISDKEIRWPPWISGGIAVTQAERLCYKLSCAACAPVVVDHAATDWADLSVIGQKGLSFWAEDSGGPFGLAADLARREIVLCLHPPAALPVPACGTLGRDFGLDLHEGHRPMVRGKGVMDASDAARELAARNIPEKRLAHLAGSLALPLPANAGPEEMRKALAASMIPLAEILNRLEPFELKGLARALEVPAPRANAPGQAAALSAMMKKLQEMK